MANNETKWYLIISIVLFPLMYCLYKYIYPFPNFSQASVSYIQLANGKQWIDNIPPGYPLLLKNLHFFSYNDFVIIVFQFLFLQIVVWDIFFSFYFLLSPAKWIMRSLFLILLINPVYINMANLIAPDCIFNSLTIFWFTNLLWQMVSPTFKGLITISITIIIASFFDHNGLWLIVPSFLLIFYNQQFYLKNLKGWLLFPGIVFLYLSLTMLHNKIKYDVNIFYPSIGWQLAGDGLFAYYYSPNINSDRLPSDFRELNNLVNHHKDSLTDLRITPDFAPNNEFFISNNDSPLKAYLKMTGSANTEKVIGEYFRLGNLYFAYGSMIIAENPGNFMRYYILPNLMFYYTPRAEVFMNYNRDLETVEEPIVNWFHYADNRVSFRYPTWRIPFMHVRVPFCFALIKIVFLAVTICYFLLTPFHLRRSKSIRFMSLVFVFFFVNVFFSILTNANTIRAQVSITTILLIYNFFVLNELFKSKEEVIEMASNYIRSDRVLK